MFSNGQCVRWRGTLGALALLAGLVWLAGPASAEIIYVEAGGRVVAEAELFSSRNGSVKSWVSIPDEMPNGSNNDNRLYQNARGGRFVEVYPDPNNTAGVGPAADTFIDYRVRISTPGEYRLYMRWAGHDGQSDSMFGQIVELMDGTGGTHADWYEDTGRNNWNFDSTGWDGVGGFEQNQAGVNPAVPMVWQISTPGDYTVRFRPREDGVSLDGFILQLASMSAPDRQVDRSPVVGELEAPIILDAPLLDDAYVRRGFPTTNYGSDQNVLAKNNGTASTTRKGYMKFELPWFPPDLLLDAELNLQVSVSNTGGSNPVPTAQTANVFALVEDVDHTWDESTLIWDGSPGNDPAVGGGDPLTGGAGANADAIFLGQLFIPAVDVTQQDVLVQLSNLDTNNALREYLLSDTDGIVSFFFTRVDGNGSWNLGFASKEHLTMLPPTLTLYVDVPEPGTLALLGVGLAVLGRRRRRT